MTDIQRTNYDAALAVAIKDAERKVVEAAERFEKHMGKWYDYTRHSKTMKDHTPSKQDKAIIEAVRELRRVRGDA